MKKVLDKYQHSADTSTVKTMKNRETTLSKKEIQMSSHSAANIQMPEKFKVMAYITGRGIEVVDATRACSPFPGEDGKHSLGYYHTCGEKEPIFKSLGANKAEMYTNVRYLVNQLTYVVPFEQVKKACKKAGIYMPEYFEWSMIRDAEEVQLVKLAKILWKNRKWEHTLAGTIAQNIGIQK